MPSPTSDRLAPIVIVTGWIDAQLGCVEALQSAALAHVRRSRKQPGCLSHDVVRGIEDAMRFYFVERWETLEALQLHLATPETRAFGQAARRLGHGPNLTIFEACIERQTRP